MPVDKRHHQRRAVAKKLQQPLPMNRTQCCRQVVRHHPEARVDQSYIATGAAEAYFAAFQEHNATTGFRQM